jgi:hypothetical protein
MAVAVDAVSQPTGAGDVHGTGTSATFQNLTVGSGSNRALVVVVTFDIQTPGTVTMTWDSGGSNQVMTQIVTLSSSAANEGTVQLWGLIAPVAGNKVLKVTNANTATDIYLDAMSFTGVDQTGGTTSFPHSTSGYATTATGTLPITSTGGNYTISGYSGGTNINSVNQTSLANDHSGTNTNYAAQYAAGAATVTHTYNLAGSPTGQGAPMVGTDIAAVAAGDTFGGAMQLMMM